MADQQLIDYLKERLDRLEDKTDKIIDAQSDLKTEFGRLKGLPTRIEKTEIRIQRIEKIEWKREGARGIVVAIIMALFELIRR